MSLTGPFDKLNINPEENADMDTEALDTGNKTKTQKPKHTKQDVFTFVTVYYKHGDWGTTVFDTLHEGLLEFVKEYSSGAESEKLLSLDDEKLLDELLVLGEYQF
jgi:hypothetical protein